MSRFKISGLRTDNAARLLKILCQRLDHGERIACSYGVHDFEERGLHKVCKREHCGAVYVIPEALADLERAKESGTPEIDHG